MAINLDQFEDILAQDLGVARRDAEAAQAQVAADTQLIGELQYALSVIKKDWDDPTLDTWVALVKGLAIAETRLGK